MVNDQDLYLVNYVDVDLDEMVEWQDLFDQFVVEKGYGCVCDIMFSLFKCFKDL